jgi:hypothetical protein
MTDLSEIRSSMVERANRIVDLLERVADLAEQGHLEALESAVATAEKNLPMGVDFFLQQQKAAKDA